MADLLGLFDDELAGTAIGGFLSTSVYGQRAIGKSTGMTGSQFLAFGTWQENGAGVHEVQHGTGQENEFWRCGLELLAGIQMHAPAFCLVANSNV